MKSLKTIWSLAFGLGLLTGALAYAQETSQKMGGNSMPPTGNGPGMGGKQMGGSMAERGAMLIENGKRLEEMGKKKQQEASEARQKGKTARADLMEMRGRHMQEQGQMMQKHGQDIVQFTASHKDFKEEPGDMGGGMHPPMGGPGGPQQGQKQPTGAPTKN